MASLSGFEMQRTVIAVSQRSLLVMGFLCSSKPVGFE